LIGHLVRVGAGQEQALHIKEIFLFREEGEEGTASQSKKKATFRVGAGQEQALPIQKLEHLKCL
jgi:hypothetical protein